MTVCYLSSVFGAGAQLFSDQGVVLAGGSVSTFQAGTTTPQATYTDSTGNTSNGTSQTLNAAGRIPQEMWIPGGVTIKIIVRDVNGVQVGNPYDNIAGVNDQTANAPLNTEWVPSGLTPSFIGATSFSFPGNVTAQYPVGQRLKLTVTAGTIYATVATVAFTSVTTITVVNDSTPIDSGLSAVQKGLFLASAPSIDAIGVKYDASIVPPTTPASIAQPVQRLDRSITQTVTSGTATAYVATPTSPLGAYATNAPMQLTFNVNSGANPTINISGLGAKNLKMYDGVTGGKIAAVVFAAEVYIVAYDGTDMVILNQTTSINGQVGAVTLSALAAFASSTFSAGVSGFQLLPSGLILQWGRLALGNYAVGASGTVTYPEAFPNKVLSLVMSLSDANGVANTGVGSIGATDSVPPTTTFGWVATKASGLTVAATLNWHAIGF